MAGVHYSQSSYCRSFTRMHGHAQWQLPNNTSYLSYLESGVVSEWAVPVSVNMAERPESTSAADGEASTSGSG